MIDQCPHCQKTLSLNEAQKNKISNALAALPPGRLLKLNCPSCQQPIELQGDGSLANAPAPGPETAPAAAAPKPAATPGPEKKAPEPPAPPDTGWLESGTFKEEEVIEDVPMSLILMEPGPKRDLIAQVLSEANSLPVFPGTARAAIEQMQFGNFATVVLHSGFETGGLAASTFHAHMRKMAMRRRRYIIYVLLGPEFKTLYDLEALAASANLVVNEADVDRFGVIFKKAQQDHDKLFGPLIEALATEGRK